MLRDTALNLIKLVTGIFVTIPVIKGIVIGSITIVPWSDKTLKFSFIGEPIKFSLVVVIYSVFGLLLIWSAISSYLSIYRGKRKWQIATIGIAYLALIMICVKILISPPRITISISGTPGLNINGTYIVSNKEHNFGPDVIPCKYTFTKGRNTSFIVKSTGEGFMSVDVLVNDKPKGSISTKGESNDTGVQGYIFNSNVLLKFIKMDN